MEFKENCYYPTIIKAFVFAFSVVSLLRSTAVKFHLNVYLTLDGKGN